MQKIPIMFLIDQMRNIGGAEKNLLNIISHLNRDRFEISLYTFQLDFPMIKILKQKKIPCKQISYPTTLRGFLKFFALSNTIRKRKIKILHSYFEGSDIWGMLLAKLSGIPVTISSKRDMGFSKNKKILTAYKFINPFVTRIIAVSEAVRCQINIQEKVNLNKIITIYNGVDISKYFVSKYNKALKSQLNLSTFSPIVGVLANIKPVKGLEFFIQAAAKVLNRFPETQFIVIGACLPNHECQSYYDKLKSLVKKLKLENNFYFVGERSDIPDLLSILDVSVLPSLSEGFSNTVLESMSAGLPLVVTDVGGNSEAVIDGKTGFVVPPKDIVKMADSINLLLANKELAKKMGREGRKRAQQLFSMDRMINKIENLYVSSLKNIGCISTI